eukprot:gene22955-biopygen8816
MAEFSASWADGTSDAPLPSASHFCVQVEGERGRAGVQLHSLPPGGVLLVASSSPRRLRAPVTPLLGSLPELSKVPSHGKSCMVRPLSWPDQVVLMGVGIHLPFTLLGFYMALTGTKAGFFCEEWQTW